MYVSPLHGTATAAPDVETCPRRISAEKSAGARKLSGHKRQTGLKLAPRPEEVIKSFNSWAFKREQPDNLDLLHRDVSAATAAGRPIPFVLYWGRGPRTAPAAPEQQCFEFLSSMFKRIEGTYPGGASATLVLTDTHAELNGYCPASTNSYFDAVSLAATPRGFGARRLSELMESAREHLDPEPAKRDPPAYLLKALVASAEKHYRGDGAAEEGAIRYFRNNMLERQAVERAFRGAIFVTFNGSDMRPLFPEGMPIFYMYSIRRGVGVKPWFMPAASVEAPRELELV